MHRIVKIYNEIEEKFSICAIAAMTIMVFFQVIARSLESSLTWSEELVRYLFIWTSWLGVSLCQKRHTHLRVTLLRDLLPRNLRIINEYIALVLAAGMAAFLAYYGFNMVFFLNAAGTLSPALKLPMAVIYLAMPVGCVVYIFRVGSDMYAMITKRIFKEMG